MSGNDLLRQLAASVDALGGCGTGLARLPVSIDGTGTWWRQKGRVYADPRTGLAGIGPYIDIERLWWDAPVVVPTGTAAITFVARGADFFWWRMTKTWSNTVVLSAGSLDEPHCSFTAHTDHMRWKPGPWTTAVPMPSHVRWLLPASDLTTGRVLRVQASDVGGGTSLALLLVAKVDTRFRRVGLWGPVSRHCDHLPAHFADLLQRGRCGEVH